MTQDDVLALTQAECDEGPGAISRPRRRRFGWDVDAQSRCFIDGEETWLLAFGEGPLIIDRHTGDYWRTSSNPVAVFGDGAGLLGYTELTSRAWFDQWLSQQGAPRDGNIRYRDA